MYELSPKAAKVFSDELKQIRDYYAKLYGWGDMKKPKKTMDERPPVPSPRY